MRCELLCTGLRMVALSETPDAARVMSEPAWVEANYLTTRRGFMRLMTALGAALVARPSGGRGKLAGGDAPDLRRDGAMRDGVRLATDVYRPMRDGKPLPGPYPVILERTPYGKHGRQPAELTRGEPHREEPRRGGAYFYRAATSSSIRTAAAATARRALRQISERRRRTATTPAPGCATSPGATGGSAPWACPTRRIPRRRSAAPIAPGWRRCAGLRRLRQRLAGRHPPGRRVRAEAGHLGVQRGARKSPEVAGRPGACTPPWRPRTSRDWFTRMPWKRGHSPLRRHPDYEAYVFDQWEHGTFDAFWKQLGI